MIEQTNIGKKGKNRLNSIHPKPIIEDTQNRTNKIDNVNNIKALINFISILRLLKLLQSLRYEVQKVL